MSTTDTANIIHNSIMSVTSLTFTTFHYTSLTHDEIKNPYDFRPDDGPIWRSSEDGNHVVSSVKYSGSTLTGTEYYAFMSSVVITRKANTWTQRNRQGMQAYESSLQRRSVIQNVSERRRTIRSDIITAYLEWCKANKVQALTIHDIGDGGKIANSAIRHFTPSINVIYVWEQCLMNSTVSDDGCTLQGSIPTIPDFISDMVLTLRIVPPHYTINSGNDSTKLLPENVPFVRMVKDPIALLLSSFVVKAQGNQELINENGMSLTIHNELDQQGNYEGLQRAFYNQSIEHSIPKADNSGITFIDTLNRSSSYTQGLQTPVPIVGEDSLLYNKDGSPKPVVISIPLRPFFSRYGMAIPTALLGSNSVLNIDVKLDNLRHLFQVITRGSNHIPPVRSYGVNVSANLHYRTANLPPYLYYTNMGAFTQYIAPVRAYSKNPTNITSTTTKIANPLRFMINSLVVFTQPDISVLNSLSSDLPSEVIPDIWSSFSRVDVRPVRELTKKVTRVGNLTGFILGSDNKNLIPFTHGPSNVPYSNLLSDKHTVSADTEFGLYTKDPFTDPTAELVSTFTFGSSSALNFFSSASSGTIFPIQLAHSKAQDLANTITNNEALEVTSRGFILSETAVASLQDVVFYVAQHVPSQSVQYFTKRCPIINHVSFSSNGSHQCIKEYTQSLSDAALVSDYSFDVPRRPGLIVFNFGNDHLDKNRASGYIQCSPQSSYIDINVTQDTLSTLSKDRLKYNIHCLYYCVSVITSKLADYQHRFGSITI